MFFIGWMKPHSNENSVFCVFNMFLLVFFFTMEDVRIQNRTLRTFWSASSLRGAVWGLQHCPCGSGSNSAMGTNQLLFFNHHLWLQPKDVRPLACPPGPPSEIPTCCVCPVTCVVQVRRLPTSSWRTKISTSNLTCFCFCADLHLPLNPEPESPQDLLAAP